MNSAQVNNNKKKLSFQMNLIFFFVLKIISSLKVLQRTDVEVEKFDKEKWSALLTPLLNLWKKLNQVE